MHFLEAFYNVRNLGVGISSDLDDKMIPSIVSLLRAVPNFTTLDIRSPRDKVFFSSGPVVSDGFISCPSLICDFLIELGFLFVKLFQESSFDSGHWQLQELDFINRIKEVTIEITDGSNGIEFAKYVLENSPSLKIMSIICAPTQKSSLMEGFRTSRVINPIMIVFLAQDNKNKVIVSAH